jgi:hypothetical protein
LAGATEETLAALADAGLLSFEGSEAQALAVLALRGGDNPEEYAPPCYQTEFAVRRSLCNGCVFSASCWQGDNRYLTALRKGEENRPLYTPTGAVTAVLAKTKPQVKPPKPRKRK